ncbi:MAG: hypothetical protein HY600_01640 [Candidatus Omnitrophica bacterium]|nr:hypothetical protein [Candidatus Omnitrophota bacterium]
MRFISRFVVGTLAVGCVATLARAESVEIVTYYPSPATVTDDLKVKRLSVGTTYQALNFDGTPPVADGTVLVEGNLAVNDVYLRSAGGGANKFRRACYRCS